ncbi:hypothetical protein F5J12DRAFT_68040 [Pisolithus orientalis]|uniref:uncharacterized protein n=1 Tax=Pisolithus orientalis TaxID=936130 RepID=UPI002224484C|nr:uncharacterized protein F5J12DRAFT_68040 [Pisolithus orientalis]KAI6008218.1 hypothetical protein F5J12DRAFT_68040 [Pisolithus orientalis]
MSSTNGRMDVDTSPNRKSSRNHSTDTHRTRRSHRSYSRDRRERHRERDRDIDERRRRSRDRGSERDYRDRERRSRSRERSHRDKDRDRDHRERDRRHRGDRRDEQGRYYDHEDRERRRKREDGNESPERDPERSKRKRHEESDDPHAPASVKDSPRSRIADRTDRSRERRYDRRVRDPRDEFDEPLRHQRDRDRRDSKRAPSDEGTLEDEFDKRSLRPSPTRQRPSPTYEVPVEDYNPEEPKEDDSEARSVFVSQLAARLTARDLGYFFEDKLGEGTVVDARIVTDRISRRSKGIGYVEFRSVDLVEKAMALSGTIVMGLPIMVQLTEAERNRLHPGDGNLNLPPGVNTSHGAMQWAFLIVISPVALTRYCCRLYVGSLHFNLTESDIRQVFEPFGELAFVDLHRDPMTGRSKGYAFIQYKRGEDAKMALEQMEGFELAGRTLRVNTVHEKGSVRYTQQDSLDEAGGGNLNAASRQALMQKLARIEPTPKLPTVFVLSISDSSCTTDDNSNKPNIPQTMQSRSVLLKNMFNPEEETERDWDRELADDVKGECEEKYGKVEIIKIEKDSQGEIYVKFGSVESAKKAIQGLNGRWFGGRQISAAFISDAIMMAHQ